MTQQPSIRCGHTLLASILAVCFALKEVDLEMFVKHYAPNYMLVDTKCQN